MVRPTVVGYAKLLDAEDSRTLPGKVMTGCRANGAHTENDDVI